MGNLIENCPTTTGGTYWVNDLGQSGKKYGVDYQSNTAKVTESVDQNGNKSTKICTSGVCQVDTEGQRGKDIASKIATALAEKYPGGYNH